MTSATTTATPIAAVAVPDDSRAARAYAAVDLADAYEIRLPAGTTTDPGVLARFIFANQPRWVGVLMRLRDAIVGRLGLKTAGGLQRAAGERVGIFKVYAKSPTEWLLGEDDRHLDFRVSVLHRVRDVAGQRAAYLVVSTVVHCHNRLGRFYIFVIAPFHRLVVKASLRRAAALGWPKQA